ncbi:MAG: chromosome partitioning protein ParB [Parcubacteria group bacterium Gr01-1014_31]|nr:MAG: chromosome partitioning protein ParB [Parcubacteria group bacterium Gr01-1014_31]
MPNTPAVTLKPQLLYPSPLQPRKHFGEPELATLMQSIRKHGLLQPLLVRRGQGERYEILAGERRYRACAKLGLAEIPCIVVQASDRDALALMLDENLERQDLTVMEVARSIDTLVTNHFNGDQVAAADCLGKSTIFVRDRLTLVHLHPELHSLLDAGKLTIGHGVEISRVDRERQVPVAQLALKRRMSVNTLKGYLQLAAGGDAKPEPRHHRRDPQTVAEKLSAHIQAIYDLVDANWDGLPLNMREMLWGQFTSLTDFLRQKNPYAAAAVRRG